MVRRLLLSNLDDVTSKSVTDVLQNPWVKKGENSPFYWVQSRLYALKSDSNFREAINIQPNCNIFCWLEEMMTEMRNLKAN